MRFLTKTEYGILLHLWSTGHGGGGKKGGRKKKSQKSCKAGFVEQIWEKGKCSGKPSATEYLHRTYINVLLFYTLIYDKLVLTRHCKEQHSDTHNRDKRVRKRAQEYKTHQGRVRHTKSESAATERGIHSTASFNIKFGPKDKKNSSILLSGHSQVLPSILSPGQIPKPLESGGQYCTAEQVRKAQGHLLAGQKQGMLSKSENSVQKKFATEGYLILQIAWGKKCGVFLRNR